MGTGHDRWSGEHPTAVAHVQSTEVLAANLMGTGLDRLSGRHPTAVAHVQSTEVLAVNLMGTGLDRLSGRHPTAVAHVQSTEVLSAHRDAGSTTASKGVVSHASGFFPFQGIARSVMETEGSQGSEDDGGERRVGLGMDGPVAFDLRGGGAG
jgi:hypothetical protein